MACAAAVERVSHNLLHPVSLPDVLFFQYVSWLLATVVSYYCHRHAPAVGEATPIINK